VLSINDTSDTLTVFNCFMDDSDANQIEQIRFADGTTWNIDKVKQRLLQPTGGDDVIIGYSGSDTLQGLGGDDLLPNLDRTTYVLECAA
jgi:Ca2+-binding RTX toxin-like protein